MPQYWNIVAVCWFTFMLWWAVAGLRVRASKRRASVRFTFANTMLLYAGFVLVLVSHTIKGPLSIRFASAQQIVGIVGATLVVCGIAVALWSRWMLGMNWSATVRIGEGQRIVCSGPYAIVAHPIYSGLLLALFGTALVADALGSVLGFVLVAIAFWQKGRLEERFMGAEFGDEYVAYRSRVKFMIPFVL